MWSAGLVRLNRSRSAAYRLAMICWRSAAYSFSVIPPVVRSDSSSWPARLDIEQPFIPRLRENLGRATKNARCRHRQAPVPSHGLHREPGGAGLRSQPLVTVFSDPPSIMTGFDRIY
jgi:hypothetical protein